MLFYLVVEYSCLGDWFVGKDHFFAVANTKESRKDEKVRYNFLVQIPPKNVIFQWFYEKEKLSTQIIFFLFEYIQKVDQ